MEEVPTEGVESAANFKPCGLRRNDFKTRVIIDKPDSGTVKYLLYIISTVYLSNSYHHISYVMIQCKSFLIFLIHLDSYDI